MATHIIDENGVVINTIEATVAEARKAYPGYTCVRAQKGGKGWLYQDGKIVEPVRLPDNTPRTTDLNSVLSEEQKQRLINFLETMP